LGQVVSQGGLILRRSEWKRNGGTVVCAAGAFDLLHPGHIRLLEQARELGDVLAVVVQDDAGIRERFGDSPKAARPVTPASERMEILAGLAAVDFVATFEGPSPRPFLLEFAPDVFVEGNSPAGRESGSHAGDLEERGCRVVRFPMEPGYSTDQLIERIIQSRT